MEDTCFKARVAGYISTFIVTILSISGRVVTSKWPSTIHDYLPILDTISLHKHKLFSSYNTAEWTIILWSQLFQIKYCQTSQEEEIRIRNTQNHLLFG